jgi:menaquinone-9 beta-reductase
MELGVPVCFNCQRMKYDLAIIGGGLAGLALSIDMARKGHSVAIIEKGCYPRHKVCGEYISNESERYLKELCPALHKLNLPVISRFQLTSGAGSSYETKLSPGGFGISRYLLEELLYKEACAAGVHFFTGTKAREITKSAEENYYDVRTSIATISAKVVCNASGRRTDIEPGSGSRQESSNYIGVKYHIRLRRNTDRIEIHNFPGGYCGISDIEEGKSCLCYIVNTEKLKAASNSISEMEKLFLFRNKQLDQIFNKAEFIFRQPLTISGINFKIKNTIRQNVFHLGDSAGTIAPVTGNGMSMGLRSAYKLAGELHLYLTGKKTKNDLEKNYFSFWNNEFSSRIKLSRHLQKLSEYPSLAGITIGAFRFIPGLAKLVIRQTHGKPF